MSPSGVPLPGGWHDFPSGYDEFTRLIEVFADPSGIHLEHNTGFPYNPIPEVNIDLIGGNLEGKADLNDTDAGWDVGLYATTGGYTGGSLWDFSAGYRIETSGTTFDGFRLAGIHGTCNRWGRGEVTLNGNTIVRDTGRQEAVAPTADILHGVHISSHYSYVALHATDASINNNKGNGISLKAKSSYDHENLVIPSGAFLDLDHCNIAQNGGHGIAMKVEEDGIVGGAWHILSGAISLINQATYNYSVEYGQGVVDGCSISNNGKAGLYFYPNRVSDGKSDIVNVRFTNCIVWNNPFGGYLADFSGSNLSPVFLAPLGHCTLAGNGNDSTYQSSLNIIEKDRSSGISGSYFWTEPAGSLSTKFYNTILERKSSSANDFAPGMLTGVYKFVMDDSLPISDDKIGAAGLRYQDGSSGPTFDKSTRLATPFVDSSSWTTLDPTKFYLSNHGTGNEFGETPTSFPLIGNETAFDHEGGSRPSASSGARDKGADEIL